jgi:hypothetical protein
VTLREDFLTCYILSYYYCLGIAENTGITFAVKVEFSFRLHIRTRCRKHLTSCSVGILESLHAGNETKARSWPLTPHLVRGYECMEFCLHTAFMTQHLDKKTTLLFTDNLHREAEPVLRSSRLLSEIMMCFLRKLKKHYRIQVISLLVPICRYPFHSFVAC